VKRTVVKFGGSVLKSPVNSGMLSRVLDSYQGPVVVVVSALFGITDKLSRILDRRKLTPPAINALINDIRTVHFELIDALIRKNEKNKMIKQAVSGLLKHLNDHLTGLMLIGDIPDSSAAYVLSFGEKLSVTVLAAVLERRGKHLTRIDPEQAGLSARGPMLNASIDFSRSGPALIRSLAGGTDYIIPGFYGISDMERISVFGRGGSDYSAAGIAACINARSCDLWKEVDGFMTADPALVTTASTIPYLSYGEAAELSYFGAKVTHPESFSAVRSKDIPLRIFSTDRITGTDIPAPSTVINSRKERNPTVIKSIAASTGFALLKIKGAGVGIHPGIISAISHRFSGAEINIRSIITSQTTINFLLGFNDIECGSAIVRELNIPDIEQIFTDKNIALVAAVGEGFHETYGVAARILAALSAERINVSLITAGASDEAIYVIIKKGEYSRAVRSLHDEFFRDQRPGQ